MGSVCFLDSCAKKRKLEVFQIFQILHFLFATLLREVQKCALLLRFIDIHTPFLVTAATRPAF